MTFLLGHHFCDTFGNNSYIFPIKFKIRILDLMLLPKTVLHLKGNTTVARAVSQELEIMLS